VKKWSFSTGNAVASSVAIGSDGTVFFGSYDTFIYAISASGTQMWNFATANSVGGSIAVGADGTLYVGSLDGKLYAIK
jgi:outer membrane protein assembly factor BamB